MKLASALLERANLQTRISELQKRLNQNAKYQEGEAPSEDPLILLAELDDCLKQLEDLISRINLTNSMIKKDNLTLTEMISKRDILTKRLSILRSFLENASSKVDRYSKTEIRILSSVDVTALQKECDQYAKTLRLLDESIQELNWTVDLI